MGDIMTADEARRRMGWDLADAVGRLAKAEARADAAEAERDALRAENKRLTLRTIRQSERIDNATLSTGQLGCGLGEAVDRLRHERDTWRARLRAAAGAADELLADTEQRAGQGALHDGGTSEMRKLDQALRVARAAQLEAERATAERDALRAQLMALANEARPLVNLRKSVCDGPLSDPDDVERAWGVDSDLADIAARLVELAGGGEDG